MSAPPTAAGFVCSTMSPSKCPVDEDVLVARGLSKDPLAILQAGVFIPGASPEVNTRIERDWSEVTAGF